MNLDSVNPILIVCLLIKCLHCSSESLSDNLNDFDTKYFKSKSNFNFTEIEFGPCNVPIEREPISQKHFINKYAYVSPVIFKKYSNERNKLFKEKCEIDNLYAEYGSK
jgi:hypothetical protein